MQLNRIAVSEEHIGTPPAVCDIFQGDFESRLPELLERCAGRAELVYFDPPFFTGKQFELKRKVERQTLTLPSYTDRWASDDFYRMMRTALEGARELLCDAGSLFVHIDYRTSAKMRLLLDEVFGESAFTNEIIWAYESGGRARNHFSRKHDVIYYYRKTPQAIWNPDTISVPRSGARDNHMKRQADEDGRTYRSIRSAGKEYRYYDDERVCPGDVWADISHLQQQDPERTGFETQKPLKLLERIVSCASNPGGLVVDLFAGSGTTLRAAQALGRAFVGVDISELSMQLCRKRLADGGVRVLHGASAAEADEPGEFSFDIRQTPHSNRDLSAPEEADAFEVTLRAFRPRAASAKLGEALAELSPLGGVFYWALGRMERGAFVTAVSEHAPISGKLAMRCAKDTQPALLISDVVGNTHFWQITEP